MSEAAKRVTAWMRLAEWLVHTEPQGTPITPEEAYKMARLCAAGWSVQEIADWTGRSFSSVRRTLEKAKAPATGGAVNEGANVQ